jgi:hypothetical protein
VRISIWRQFSSNHSSDFTIIGEFETPEAAQRAANQLREIFEIITEWHREHPEVENEVWREEEPPYYTPTPIELEIGKRLGIAWPYAVEWYKNAIITRELGRLVYIKNEWHADSDGKPFDQVMERLGGKSFLESSGPGDQAGSVLVNITCSAPDEITAQTIVDQYLTDETELWQIGNQIICRNWRFPTFDLPELIGDLSAQNCTDIQFTFQQSTDQEELDEN